MTLLSRLLADTREARRLRQARAAIRRAEHALAERQRIVEPGYDDLNNPVFFAVMLVAVIVLVADIRGDMDSSVLISWFRAAAAALKGIA